MVIRTRSTDPALAGSRPKPAPPISAPRAKSDIWQNIAAPPKSATVANIAPPEVTVAPATPAPTPAPPPAAQGKKTPVTIRLDADVLEAFRKTGPGWQSRINAALRNAVFPRA